MNLKYEVKRLALRHPWTIARSTSDTKENVFLSLEHDGITGYGEAAPNIRYGETAATTLAAIETVAEVVQAADLRQFTDLSSKIRETLPQAASARAALEMAILDWFCKRLNLPLYGYFGLNKANTPATSYSIGIDEPSKIREKVLAADPFLVLKIKLGLENDEQIIDTVRSITRKPLRVDANEGWKTREEALAKIKWLESEGVEFVEQPMPAAMDEDTAWLRKRVQMPLIADESVMTARDIPRLAEAFDGINIKVMKAGGILETLRMVVMAKSLDMKVMLGCMVESSLAISAAASLSPLVDYADLDGNLLITNDPFDGVKVKSGKLHLADRPGLGAEPIALKRKT
ncbi:MAG: dipeptide epimerase [bacterium]